MHTVDLVYIYICVLVFSSFFYDAFEMLSCFGKGGDQIFIWRCSKGDFKVGLSIICIIILHKHITLHHHEFLYFMKVYLLHIPEKK